MYLRYTILVCVISLLIVVVGCGRSRNDTVPKVSVSQSINTIEIKAKITPAHKIWSEYETLRTDQWIMQYGKDAIVHYMMSVGKDTDENLIFKYLNYFVSKGLDVNAKNDSGFTPLHITVENNRNIEVVKFLVVSGSDVNAKSRGGYTPLHLAAYCKNSTDVGIVEFLISKGASIIAKNDIGETSLDLAKKRGNTAVVKYLSDMIEQMERKAAEEARIRQEAAEKRAAEEERKRREEAERRVAEEARVRREEAERKVAEEARKIQEEGDRFIKLSGKDAIIHYMMSMGKDMDEKLIIKYLNYFVSKGADVNAKNTHSNSTPLHEAVRSRNIEIVKFLVTNGADVNAKGAAGFTPLHIAAADGNIEVVEFLISNRANIIITNNSGETALDLATKYRNTAVAKYLSDRMEKMKQAETERRAAEEARKKQEAERRGAEEARVRREEAERKAAEEARKKQEEAERKAAEEAQKIQEEAEGFIKQYGKDALREAVSVGKIKVVEYLVSHGADVRAKTENGATILHYAAAGRQGLNFAVVQYLVSKGVYVRAKDDAGKTPIDWAREAKNTAIAEYLAGLKYY